MAGEVVCSREGKSEDGAVRWDEHFLSVPCVLILCPQLNGELEHKGGIFHFSLPWVEPLVRTGKIGLSRPTVGRSSSPTTLFEETEVRVGDPYLKIHDEKWCWAGSQVAGFPVKGFFLLISMMYWALLLSDLSKAPLPLGGAHYVVFQVPSLLWEGCLPGAQGLTGKQVIVQQLLLDDVIGHHLSTVDNGIPRDVGESSCWKGSVG